MNIGYISAIAAAAVFFIVLTVALLADKKNYRPENDKEWLFTDWEKKLYRAFGGKDAAKSAKSLGIDINRYESACRLLGEDPGYEQIVVHKVLGVAILVALCAIGALTGNIAVMITGIMIGSLLVFLPGRSVLSKAREKKDLLINELPRFLDMLETALFIGLPIEEAINLTSKYLEGTILAEEFSLTMSDVRIGATDWQGALSKMSAKYDITEFSEFVNELTISYNKGLNIYDMVKRRSREMRQTNLITIKEKAASMNNTILVPIVIFEFIPMLAIMLIPIVVQLNESGIF